VDVAIVWGPLGGYFAQHEPVALAVQPIDDAVDRTGIVFAFPIAVGVRQGDTALRDAIQRVLDRRHTEISRLLAAFGVETVKASRSTTEDREGARRAGAGAIKTDRNRL
jgi:hypothetical protein